MITSRTWTPNKHSLLRLEQNNDGKFALYVGGRSTGFHDIETIFTALDLMQASDESLRIVQAMRNEMPHRQESLVHDAYDLWCMLIGMEIMKEVEDND